MSAEDYCPTCGAVYIYKRGEPRTGCVPGRCVREEKPLHVRVAEALGWKRIGACPLCCEDPDRCYGGGVWPDGHVQCAPRYDADWAATGPLVEKYVRSVHNGKGWVCKDPDEWNAIDVGDTRCGRGATPLIAVCNLILKLKEDEKL